MSAKKRKTDLLQESTVMLRELNSEINRRFEEIPEDVQALLIQKGALLQTATRELHLLLDQSAERLEQFEALMDHCERWREDFFLPLRAQCDDVPLEDPVDTDDMKQLVREMDEALKQAGRKPPIKMK